MRSLFFKATAVSDLSGEKWQTQLLRDTHVGNAIPANTTAITQEALIRRNSGLAGYMHVVPISRSLCHSKISDEV